MSASAKLASAAQLPWDPSLETGDLRVDLQHMQLFATVSDLQVAFEAGVPRQELADAVIDLLHYARAHFADEEALMEASAYPYTAAQQIAHAKFVSDVQRVASDYFIAHDASIEPLLAYARGWLTDHVNTLDRSLADHLRARNA